MNAFEWVRFAALSDLGRKRKNNEDSYGTFPEIGVWLVADGMGGGDDGEIASAATVEAVEEFAATHPFPEGSAFAADELARTFENVFCKASAWIFNRAKERKLSGCGSTVVGVAIDATNPGHAVAFHAGDSRLYRVRGFSIKQITKDHSAAELIGAKDESKMNPMFRGMILRAVGVHPKVELELTPFDVKRGDRILICSDGLSRMVPDRKLKSILRDDADVEKTVRELIDAANEAGGIDNITAEVLMIGDLPEPLPKAELPKGATAEDSVTDTSRGSSTDRDTTDTAETNLMTAVTQCTNDETIKVVTLSDLGLKNEKSQKRHGRHWMAFAALVLSAVVAVIAAAVLVHGMKREKVETPHDGVQTATSAAETYPSAKPPARGAMRSAPPHEAVSMQGGGVSPASERQVFTPDQVATNDTAVATNEDVVVTTPVVPVVEEVEPPVSTNVLQAVTNAAPVVANPPPAITNLPPKKANGALVGACEKHEIDAFAAAIRKRLPADKRFEFAEQIKRLSSSARDCARMKTEKTAQKLSVDLKYVLISAHSVREALPTTGTGALALARAWDAVEKGDGDSAALQRACAEVLMRVRDELK